MVDVFWWIPGADPGFQVRGEHLIKLRRAEGGAKFFWVFRVKNHDFTPKNLFASNFRAPPGYAPGFESWSGQSGYRGVKPPQCCYISGQNQSI